MRRHGIFFVKQHHGNIPSPTPYSIALEHPKRESLFWMYASSRPYVVRCVVAFEFESTSAGSVFTFTSQLHNFSFSTVDGINHDAFHVPSTPTFNIDMCFWSVFFSLVHVCPSIKCGGRRVLMPMCIRIDSINCISKLAIQTKDFYQGISYADYYLTGMEDTE